MAETEGTGEALEGQEFVMPNRKQAAQTSGKQEPASQEKPSTDGEVPPAKEQGQEPRVEQGTKEADPWWKPLGFKSESDAVDSYGNLRAELTKKAQELSQTKEERAYYQGLMDSMNKQSKEPEMTDEQWDEMYQQSPSQAMRLRDEMLMQKVFQNPTITETVNLTRQSQANLLLSDLRSKHSDFVEYEDAIAQELQDMGPDAGLMARSPQSLERIYRMLRAEKHAQIVKQHEERLAQANKQVDQGTQKFANIGANSMNAGTPTNAGVEGVPQTVRTKVGEISVDDMEFVLSPQSKIIR